MKALTLTEPWATLVALGKKRIETRSWSTPYRGPLAIHVARGFPRDCRDLCLREPFRSALGELAEQLSRGELKRGIIVAVCTLTACKRILIGKTAKDTLLDDLYMREPDEPELSFGNYEPGRFGWILENIVACPDEIEVRGALGVWEVPRGLLPTMQDQL